MYVAAYHGDYPIPDPGYRVLFFALSSTGLPYEGFLVLNALLTILVVRRLSKTFSVSFELLLLVYFLHFFIVRDLSQVRIGVAISLATLGLTSERRGLRWFYYLIASSIHITSLLLIILYEAANLISQARKRNGYIFTLIVVVLLGVMRLILPALGGFDARVEAYTSAEEQGAPVSDASVAAFHMLILLYAYLQRKRIFDGAPALLAIALLELFGIVIFWAFHDFQIIAFRLSGLVWSLYPVLFVAALEHHRLKIAGYSVSNISRPLVLLSIGLILISRYTTHDVLSEIGFG